MINQRRQYQDNQLEQLDLIYMELVKLYNNISTNFAVPEYADDAAADADSSFESGKLYTVTGDRTIYKKP